MKEQLLGLLTAFPFQPVFWNWNIAFPFVRESSPFQSYHMTRACMTPLHLALLIPTQLDHSRQSRKHVKNIWVLDGLSRGHTGRHVPLELLFFKIMCWHPYSFVYMEELHVANRPSLIDQWYKVDQKEEKRYARD